MTSNFESNVKSMVSSRPQDPILIAVQSWLYDDIKLQTLINDFCEKNQKKYARDPDAVSGRIYKHVEH